MSCAHAPARPVARREASHGSRIFYTGLQVRVKLQSMSGIMEIDKRQAENSVDRTRIGAIAAPQCPTNSA